MPTYTNNKTGTFHTCNAPIRKHILNTYLAAKIADLVGANVNDNTIINIPHQYNNSEGVIRGMENGVKGLRVDLQKAQQVSNRTYATFQVQYGTGMGSTGGAFAGVLMRTGTDFTFAELRTAMEKSFEWGKYTRLDP